MDRSQCLVWLRRMALACCVFWAAPAGAEVSVPTLSDPVTDLAGVLAREDRQQLNSQLQAHYAAGHAQLAVLILASTDGEPVDDFAFRVASAWQLGRAGADDGVLFVLATQDRRMRLEVGYGLEHCIPDGTARAWLDELKPKLAEERYAAATQQLTGHLIEATQRCEPGSAVAPAPSKSRQQRSNPLLWMGVFFVGSVVGRVLVGVAGRNRAESKQARQASRRRAWALVVVLGGLAGLALWMFGLGWFYFSAGILGGLLGAFFLWRLRNVAGSLIFLFSSGFAALFTTLLLDDPVIQQLALTVAVFVWALILSGQRSRGNVTFDAAHSSGGAAPSAFSRLSSMDDDEIAAFMRSSTSVPNTGVSPWSPSTADMSSHSSFGSSGSSSGDSGGGYAGGGGSFGGGGASSSW